MSTDGKIIDIDVEGLKSEIKALENAIVNFSKVSEAAVGELQKKMDALGVANFKEVSKAMKESEAIMKATKKAVDERTLAEKQLSKAQERLAALQSEQAKETAKVRIEMRELNKDLKNAAALQFELADAMENGAKSAEDAATALGAMEARLILLKEEYDAMSATVRKSDAGKKIAQEMRYLTSEIDVAKASTRSFSDQVKAGLNSVAGSMQNLVQGGGSFKDVFSSIGGLFKTLAGPAGLIAAGAGAFKIFTGALSESETVQKGLTNTLQKLPPVIENTASSLLKKIGILKEYTTNSELAKIADEKRASAISDLDKTIKNSTLKDLNRQLQEGKITADQFNNSLKKITEEGTKGTVDELNKLSQAVRNAGNYNAELSSIGKQLSGVNTKSNEELIKLANTITTKYIPAFEARGKAGKEGIGQAKDLLMQINKLIQSNDSLSDSIVNPTKELRKQAEEIKNVTFEWKVFQEQEDDLVTATDLVNNMNIRSSQIMTTLNDNIVKLYDDWKNGIIDTETLEKQLQATELKASEDVLKNQIGSIEELLAITKLDISERVKYEEQLAKIKSDLAKQTAQTQIDEEKKSAEKAKELAKELQDFYKKMEDQLKEIFQGIAGSISDSFESELIKIDKLSERYDKYYEKRKTEIDVLYTDENATQEEIAKNQEKRTKLKAELDLESIRQEEKLEKQRQDIAIRQAKWEKTSAIASIGWSTAQAIMNAWATTKPTAAAIALTVAIAAAGALQTARVLSTPLPQFEKGGTVGKENTVLWGEKRPEVAVEPSGKIHISKAPTIQTFQPGTEIFPSIQKYNETVEKHKLDNELLSTALLRQIAEKDSPYMNVTLDENGLVKIMTKGGDRVIYKNRLSRVSMKS